MISIHKRTTPSKCGKLSFANSHLVNLTGTAYSAYTSMLVDEISYTITKHSYSKIPGFIDDYAITLCGMMKK